MLHPCQWTIDFAHATPSEHEIQRKLHILAITSWMSNACCSMALRSASNHHSRNCPMPHGSCTSGGGAHWTLYWAKTIFASGNSTVVLRIFGRAFLTIDRDLFMTFAFGVVFASLLLLESGSFAFSLPLLESGCLLIKSSMPCLFVKQTSAFF